MARSAATMCRWYHPRRAVGTCAKSPGRGAARLRAGAAGRQQGRLQRLPRAISRWLLREPCKAPAREDRGRGSSRRRDREGAGRGGRAGAPCRRGCAEGRAGQGRSGCESREQARLAAEKAKQVAQDQAAEAERQRTETAAAVKPATAAPSAEKAANLAALTPAPPPADVTKSVQTELRRVGCFAAAADGDWNAASQRSLSQFDRYAKTKFDVKIASSDALDAIRQKSSRVCPMVCEHGFKADGDHCSRIACADGSFLNDDNECERRRGKAPLAKRDEKVRQESFREQLRPEVSAPSHRHRARARSFAIRAVAARCSAVVTSNSEPSPRAAPGKVAAATFRSANDGARPFD
jgi:hypothetical protein